METSKVNWKGVIVGVILGAILFFAFFLLVIPNWKIFP